MRFSRRELRGAGIVYLGQQIRRESNSLFIVNSQSRQGEYRVEWLGPRERWACDCEDFSNRSPVKAHFICKHQAAVNWALAAPLVLLANAPVVAGGDDHNRESSIVYLHRPVSVSDLLLAYRSTLSSLEDLRDALRCPPRPRLTRRTMPPSQSRY